MSARDERGIALVMALGFLLVLTIVGAGLTYYATTDARSTDTSDARGQAFTIAEAGLNQAASVLEAAADPTLATTLPSSSTPGTMSLDAGTASWSGSYDAASGVWTVTATGSIRNPSTNTNTTKTVSQQFKVNSSSAWNYIYEDNPGACLTLSSTVQVTEPMYLQGSLCLSSSAKILSTASPVTVAGTIQTSSSATVGTAVSPLAALHVGGGCRYGASGSFTTPCTGAQQVYATSQDSTIDTTVTKPTINLAGSYASAQPGPQHACTSGSFPGGFDNDTTLNGSLPTIDLMPNSAYSCTVTSGGTTIGQISWAPGTPGTLTINGTIFFDGNISMTGNSKGLYSGRAAIYASGTVSMSSTTQLCGAYNYASSQCDWTNWNPNTNQLVLVAGSTTATPDFTLTSNSMFQGAAYATTDYSQSSNVKQEGPIAANNLSLSSGSQSGWPQNSTVPPGAPGGANGVKPIAGTWHG